MLSWSDILERDMKYLQTRKKGLKEERETDREKGIYVHEGNRDEGEGKLGFVIIYKEE